MPGNGFTLNGNRTLIVVTALISLTTGSAGTVLWQRVDVSELVQKDQYSRDRSELRQTLQDLVHKMGEVSDRLAHIEGKLEK